MLVQFIRSEVVIRPYSEKDSSQLVAVYKSAFAEEPWNEYVKCVSCNMNYGIKDILEITCKNCKNPLEVVEFWSTADIKSDLKFAQKQLKPIILVAESNNRLQGFTWGYALPLEKFPFLEGRIGQDANYMDEIAVRGNARIQGIGTMLGDKYITSCIKQGIQEIVLRTDERNTASMSLFRKLGFTPISQNGKTNSWIYDPEYSERIYLRRGTR
ncbi:MAG: GNAT family N-acetyltransferase [Candidatus Woesearchaeota archaeon]